MANHFFSTELRLLLSLTFMERNQGLMTNISVKHEISPPTPKAKYEKKVYGRESTNQLDLPELLLAISLREGK